MKQAFTNAHIVSPDHEAPLQGSIITDGDYITAIGDVDIPADARKRDMKGALLAPGIVDLGVFTIDKPAFHSGGITRAALMPDQVPPLDLPAMIKHNASEGKPDLWSHPLAAATKGLLAQELAEIALMKQAGARAVATGRKWIIDSGLMEKLMQYCKALDLILIIHSEDSNLIGDAVATAGETATLLGLPSAPAIAEAMAVQRDIMLVRETGCRVHFRQLTTGASLEIVRSAKAEGLPVTCGITPAHLFLSEIAVHDFRTFAKISPPLRSEEDRKSCIDAIADGTIDVIASGHDPRGPEDKRLPFTEAAEGMSGAETMFALSLGLVRDGDIDLNRLFALLAANPAKILNVKAGVLAPGYEADFIAIDTEEPWQIDARKMTAYASNTPFDKMPVQGSISAIYKGGQAL